jgi:dihydrofolate reductase
VSDDDPVAAKLNSMPKYVASQTLGDVTWNNATLLAGDVGDAIAALKKQPDGEIQVHGSGDLLQTLLKHDLVDEFRLWVFPVVLGSGKRLFAGGAIPGALKLIDAKTASTGVVIHTYKRAGPIDYGSFEVDEQGETAKLWT